MFGAGLGSDLQGTKMLVPSSKEKFTDFGFATSVQVGISGSRQKRDYLSSLSLSKVMTSEFLCKSVCSCISN